MSERKAQFFSTGGTPQVAPQPQSQAAEQSPGGLEVGILQRAPNVLRGYGRQMRTLKVNSNKTKDAVQSAASNLTAAINSWMKLDASVREMQQQLAMLSAQIKSLDENYAHRAQLIEQIAAARVSAAQQGMQPPAWADYSAVFNQMGMQAQAGSSRRQVHAQGHPAPAAPPAAQPPAQQPAAQPQQAPQVQQPQVQQQASTAEQEAGYKSMVQTQLQQQVQMQRAPMVFQQTQLDKRIKDMTAMLQQAQQSYQQYNAAYNEALGQLNAQTGQMSQLANDLQDYQDTTLGAWQEALSGVYGVKGGEDI